jgi:tryptophanyl-tRNA synthetase
MIVMQRLFSGIQPSGNLHLGNYLGAIKQWVELQNDYEAFFCVVDLHAITVPQDPAELRKKILEIAKIYLAAGINPEKSTIFIQSHITGHTELGWILNTVATMGELGRMTQFKDKAGVGAQEVEGAIDADTDNFNSAFTSLKPEELKELVKKLAGVMVAKQRRIENITSVGLFDYPVLMAADILLYDTAVVPVGEDQKQHVELTRDLAQRFNNRFGETFVLPEPLITKEGARIMGLDDPTKKMSKSAASEYNYIALTDDADAVRKKIKKAVTDSGSEIVYSDEKPALRNLINIYTLLSGKSTQEIEAMYQGKGYGDFKSDLAEVVVNFLVPFQERLTAISDEEALRILRAGAEKARALSEQKIKGVYEKVGFVR